MFHEASWMIQFVFKALLCETCLTMRLQLCRQLKPYLDFIYTWVAELPWSHNHCGVKCRVVLWVIVPSESQEREKQHKWSGEKGCRQSLLWCVNSAPFPGNHTGKQNYLYSVMLYITQENVSICLFNPLIFFIKSIL